jgi:hypothetical protein
VPRLQADRRESPFDQASPNPLRTGPSLQTGSNKIGLLRFQCGDDGGRSAIRFPLPDYPAFLIHDANRHRRRDTSNPAKTLMPITCDGLIGSEHQSPLPSTRRRC